jgi:hypothetical protein
VVARMTETADCARRRYNDSPPDVDGHAEPTGTRDEGSQCQIRRDQMDPQWADRTVMMGQSRTRWPAG